MGAFLDNHGGVCCNVHQQQGMLGFLAAHMLLWYAQMGLNTAQGLAYCHGMSICASREMQVTGKVSTAICLRWTLRLSAILWYEELLRMSQQGFFV